MIDNVEEFYNAIGYNSNESVVFCYTYQCNIQCDHCCYNCGPHRTEKMDSEDAKRILKGVASSGIRFVELLGGEPFLDSDTLSELLVYSSGLGLDVVVETNGFWGRTVETAKAVLSDLCVCGLKGILVSIDTFHQKFIPLAYPLNVIRAARELGITNWINFSLSSDSEKDRTLLNDLKKETEHIFIINLFPYGRGASLQVIPDIWNCNLVIKSIVVNGDTFACCGISDENKDVIDTPLYMGNCIRENPEEVLGRKNCLSMQSFFDPNSPIWFKKILQQAPYKKMFENKQFSHMCGLCKEMLHIEEISRKIMEFGN